MTSFTDSGKEYEALITVDQRMVWSMMMDNGTYSGIWVGLELRAGDVVRMPAGGVREGHIPEVVAKMSRIWFTSDERKHRRGPPDAVVLKDGTAHDWVDGLRELSPEMQAYKEATEVTEGPSEEDVRKILSRAKLPEDYDFVPRDNGGAAIEGPDGTYVVYVPGKGLWTYGEIKPDLVVALLEHVGVLKDA